MIKKKSQTSKKTAEKVPGFPPFVPPPQSDSIKAPWKDQAAFKDYTLRIIIFLATWLKAAWEFQ